jgi:hypothetical protein
VHRCLVPVVGSAKVMDDHMRHGHETNLIAAGLKPEQIKEIPVPSIAVKQKNRHFALKIRELKSEHRITARDFILFAQQHLKEFATANKWDHWLHPGKKSCIAMLQVAIEKNLILKINPPNYLMKNKSYIV